MNDIFVPQPVISIIIKDGWPEENSAAIIVGAPELADGVYELYTAPQPEPERELVRREHAKWSDATFGSIGPVGSLKHLSKEALEAAADPSDSLVWADMQFLLWDAQRRMGISDRFITRAMIEKLAINKARQWPEPKDGEPRLHIKEQPAPVVPEILLSAMEEVLRISDRDHEAWHKARNGIASCRAAMSQHNQK